MMPTADLYAGVMSGTSVDGVDVALVRFNDSTPSLQATHFTPFPEELRDRIISLFSPGQDDLETIAALDHELGIFFAETVLTALKAFDTPTARVSAIGCHGQTIRHRPNLRFPFSIQIGNPNVIAELTGITTVADFRQRDIAAKGQGAPLVPAFHQAVFARKNAHQAIVNIGGIANVTLLEGLDRVRGFDCGPGNALLDAWCKQHTGMNYDRGGEWSRTGQVRSDLLERLMSEPYLHVPPPKSTGKELFHMDWLAEKAGTTLQNHTPADIAATLVEFTASGIAMALSKFALPGSDIHVCGGGAHNTHLMEAIQRLTGCQVTTTRSLGIDPDWVEAMAFAWLARQTMLGLAGNLPEVTGASGPRILGGVFQK